MAPVLGLPLQASSSTLFKIPPAVNIASFPFAMYETPGMVPDFLGCFNSNTLPTLAVSCCANPLLAPSLVWGSASQRRLGDIPQGGSSSFALFFYRQIEILMSLRHLLLFCTLTFSSLPADRRSLATAFWMLCCPLNPPRDAEALVHAVITEGLQPVSFHISGIIK